MLRLFALKRERGLSLYRRVIVTESEGSRHILFLSFFLLVGFSSPNKNTRSKRGIKKSTLVRADVAQGGYKEIPSSLI